MLHFFLIVYTGVCLFFPFIFLQTLWGKVSYFSTLFLYCPSFPAFGRVWNINMGFPWGSACKESACNVGDLGLIPGLGRSLGEGKRYPLQCSGLENSMDCIDHGVTKSQTWLNNLHFSDIQWYLNTWDIKEELTICIPFLEALKFIWKIKTSTLKLNINSFLCSCFYLSDKCSECSLAIINYETEL